MTVTIDLTPELETELRDEAAKEGLDASNFILNTLKKHLRQNHRTVPHLSKKETALLEAINFRWSPEEQKRFDRLVAGRRAHKLTSEELAELTAMTDQSEKQAAERVRAVGELARLRKLPFETMWHQLGINA